MIYQKTDIDTGGYFREITPGSFIAPERQMEESLYGEQGYRAQPSEIRPEIYELDEIEGIQPTMSLADVQHLMYENQSGWRQALAAANNFLSIGIIAGLYEDADALAGWAMRGYSGLFGELDEMDKNIGNPYNTVLGKWAQNIQEWSREATPLYESPFEQATSVEVVKGVESLGSTVRFFIPAYATEQSVLLAGKLLAKTGVLPAMSPIARGITQVTGVNEQLVREFAKRTVISGAASLVQTNMEAKAEANETFFNNYNKYLQNINSETGQKYTPEEADALARRDAANVEIANRKLLYLSNAAQYFLLTTPWSKMIQRGTKFEKSLPKILAEPGPIRTTWKALYHPGVRGFIIGGLEAGSQGAEEGLQYIFQRDADYAADVEMGTMPATDMWFRARNAYTKEGQMWWNTAFGAVGQLVYAGGFSLAKKMGLGTDEFANGRNLELENIGRSFTDYQKNFQDVEGNPDLTDFLRQNAIIEMAIRAAKWNTVKQWHSMFDGTKLHPAESMERGVAKDFIDNIDEYRKLFDETVQQYTRNEKEYHDFNSDATKVMMNAGINLQRREKLKERVSEEKRKYEQNQKAFELTSEATKLMDATIEQSKFRDLVGIYEGEVADRIKNGLPLSGDIYFRFPREKAAEYRTKHKEATDKVNSLTEKYDPQVLRDDKAKMDKVPKTSYLAALESHAMANDNYEYFNARLNEISNPKWRDTKREEAKTQKTENRRKAKTEDTAAAVRAMNEVVDINEHSVDRINNIYNAERTRNESVYGKETALTEAGKALATERDRALRAFAGRVKSEANTMTSASDIGRMMTLTNLMRKLVNHGIDRASIDRLIELRNEATRLQNEKAERDKAAATAKTDAQRDKLRKGVDAAWDKLEKGTKDTMQPHELIGATLDALKLVPVGAELIEAYAKLGIFDAKTVIKEGIVRFRAKGESESFIRTIVGVLKDIYNFLISNGTIKKDQVAKDYDLTDRIYEDAVTEIDGKEPSVGEEEPVDRSREYMPDINEISKSIAHQLGDIERTKHTIISIARIDETWEGALSQQFDPNILDHNHYGVGYPIEYFLLGYGKGKLGVDEEMGDLTDMIEVMPASVTEIREKIVRNEINKDQIIYGIRPRGARGKVAGTAHAFSSAYTRSGKRIKGEYGVDANIEKFMRRLDKYGQPNTNHMLSQEQYLENFRNGLFEELVTSQNPFVEGHVKEKMIGHVPYGDEQKTATALKDIDKNIVKWGILDGKNRAIHSNLDGIEEVPYIDPLIFGPKMEYSGLPVMLVPSSTRANEGGRYYAPTFVGMDHVDSVTAEALAHIIASGNVGEFTDAMATAGMDPVLWQIKTVNDIVRLFVHEGGKSNFLYIKDRVYRAGKDNTADTVALTDEQGIIDHLRKNILYSIKTAVLKKGGEFPDIKMEGDKLVVMPKPYSEFLSEHTTTNVRPVWHPGLGEWIFMVQPNINIGIRDQGERAMDALIQEELDMKTMGKAEKQKADEEVAKLKENMKIFKPSEEERGEDFSDIPALAGDLQGSNNYNASVITEMLSATDMSHYDFLMAKVNALSDPVVVEMVNAVAARAGVVPEVKYANIRSYLTGRVPQEWLDRLNRVGAIFISKGNEIIIDDANILKTYTPVEYVFAHEMLHLATVKAFKNPKTVTEKQFKADITKLYDYAKPIYRKTFGEAYGFRLFINSTKKSIDDFISEYYGNRLFRDNLKTIKYGKKNIFETILDFIKRLFGLKVSDKNIGDFIEEYTRDFVSKADFTLHARKETLSEIQKKEDWSLLPSTLSDREAVNAIDWMYGQALENIDKVPKDSSLAGVVFAEMNRWYDEYLGGLLNGTLENGKYKDNKTIAGWRENLKRIVYDDATFKKLWDHVRARLANTAGLHVRLDDDMTDDDNDDGNDVFGGKDSFSEDPMMKISAETRMFFSMIPRYDAKDRMIRGSFGWAEYMSPEEAFNGILMDIGGTKGDDIVKRLEELSVGKPHYKNVAQGLRDLLAVQHRDGTGKTATELSADRNKYNGIVNSLSKRVRKFVTVRNTTNPRVTEEVGFGVRQAKVDQWREAFDIIGRTNGMVVVDDKGETYIDTRVTQKFVSEYFDLIQQKNKNIVSYDPKNSIFLITVEYLNKIGISVDARLFNVLNADPSVVDKKYSWMTEQEKRQQVNEAANDFVLAAKDVFNTLAGYGVEPVRLEDDEVHYVKHDPFRLPRSMQTLAVFDAIYKGAEQSIRFNNPKGNPYYTFGQYVYLDLLMEKLHDKQHLSRLRTIYPNNKFLSMLLLRPDIRSTFDIYNISGYTKSERGGWGQTPDELGDKEKLLMRMVHFSKWDAPDTPVHGDRKVPYIVKSLHFSVNDGKGGIANAALDELFNIFMDETVSIKKTQELHRRVLDGELTIDNLVADLHYGIDADGQKSMSLAAGLDFHYFPEINDNSKKDDYIAHPQENKEEIKGLLREMAMLVADNTHKTLISMELSQKDIPEIIGKYRGDFNTQLRELAIDYSVNYMIVNGYLGPLLYNNTAQYGSMLKQYKRLSAGTSPADLTAYDSQEQIKTHFIEDPLFPLRGGAEIYEAIEKVLPDDERKEERLRQYMGWLNLEGKDYPKPSDSQAIIFLPLYKRIMSRLGRMPNRIKNLIEKLERGEEPSYDEIFEGVQDVKMLYVNDVWDDRLGIYKRVIIKASFMPFYEGLVKGFGHASQILDKMKDGTTDMIVFNSGVKVGMTNPVRVYDDNGNFDPSGINESTVNLLPQMGMLFQIANPRDEDEETTRSVSQFRKGIFADMKDPEFADIKITIDGKEYTVQELHDRHEMLWSAKVKKSYNRFLERYSIVQNTETGRYAIKDMSTFIRKIRSEVQKRYGMYIAQAFDPAAIDPTKPMTDPANLSFAIHPMMMVNAMEVMQFVNSLFYNSITRQDIYGNIAVEASPVFFNRIDAKELAGLSAEQRAMADRFGMGMYNNYHIDTQGRVQPAEVGFAARVFEDLKDYPDTPLHEVAELLRVLVHRIPNQYASSSQAATMKPLSPEIGNMVIVNSQFAHTSNSDKDFDKNKLPQVYYERIEDKETGKRYLRVKRYSDKGAKWHYDEGYSAIEGAVKLLAGARNVKAQDMFMQSIYDNADNLRDNTLIDALESARDNATPVAELVSTLTEIVKNKPSFDVWKGIIGEEDVAMFNSSKAIENAIFDIYYGMLLNKKMLPKVFYRNLVDILKGEGSIYEILRGISGYKAPSQFLNPNHQHRLEKVSYAGKRGNAIMALHSVNHSLFQWTDARVIGRGIQFKDQEGKSLTDSEDGLRLLNKTRDVKGRLISENILAMWSLTLDMMKDPEIMEVFNISLHTLPSIGTMLRLGLDIETAVAFAAQPEIRDLIRVAENSPKRTPYGRLADGIAIKLNRIKDKIIGFAKGKDVSGIVSTVEQIKPVGMDELIGNIEKARRYDALTDDEKFSYLSSQFNILSQFQYITKIGSDLSFISNTINADVRPRKSLRAIQRSLDNFKKIGDDGFTYVEGVQKLLQGTFIGSVMNYGVKPSYDVMTDRKIFPVESNFYRSATAAIIRETKFFDDSRFGMMLKHSAAYLNTLHGNGVVPEDIDFETFRAELSKGEKSVATLVRQYAKTPRGKKNPLIRYLRTSKSQNPGWIDRVWLDVNRSDKQQAQHLINGLIELMEGDEAEKVIAQRFISLSYLQNAGNIGRMGLTAAVPPKYMVAIGYGRFYNSQGFSDVLNNKESGERFAKQFILNNSGILDNIETIADYNASTQTWTLPPERVDRNYFRDSKYNVWRKHDVRGGFITFVRERKLGAKNFVEYNANGEIGRSIIASNNPLIISPARTARSIVVQKPVTAPVVKPSVPAKLPLAEPIKPAPLQYHIPSKEDEQYGEELNKIATKNEILDAATRIMGDTSKVRFADEFESNPDAVGRYFNDMTEFILGKATKVTALHEPIHWFLNRVLTQEEYDFLRKIYKTEEKMVDEAIKFRFGEKSFLEKVEDILQWFWIKVMKFFGFKLSDGQTVMDIFYRIGVDKEERSVSNISKYLLNEAPVIQSDIPVEQSVNLITGTPEELVQTVEPEVFPKQDAGIALPEFESFGFPGELMPEEYLESGFLNPEGPVISFIDKELELIYRQEANYERFEEEDPVWGEEWERSFAQWLINDEKKMADWYKENKLKLPKKEYKPRAKVKTMTERDLDETLRIKQFGDVLTPRVDDKIKAFLRVRKPPVAGFGIDITTKFGDNIAKNPTQKTSLQAPFSFREASILENEVLYLFHQDLMKEIKTWATENKKAIPTTITNSHLLGKLNTWLSSKYALSYYFASSQRRPYGINNILLKDTFSNIYPTASGQEIFLSNGLLYDNNAGSHGFKLLGKEGEFTDINYNGLAWYIEFNLNDKERVIYEQQSDILPEIERYITSKKTNKQNIREMVDSVIRYKTGAYLYRKFGFSNIANLINNLNSQVSESGRKKAHAFQYIIREDALNRIRNHIKGKKYAGYVKGLFRQYSEGKDVTQREIITKKLLSFKFIEKELENVTLSDIGYSFSDKTVKLARMYESAIADYKKYSVLLRKAENALNFLINNSDWKNIFNDYANGIKERIALYYNTKYADILKAETPQEEINTIKKYMEGSGKYKDYLSLYQKMFYFTTLHAIIKAKRDGLDKIHFLTGLGHSKIEGLSSGKLYATPEDIERSPLEYKTIGPWWSALQSILKKHKTIKFSGYSKLPGFTKNGTFVVLDISGFDPLTKIERFPGMVGKFTPAELSKITDEQVENKRKECMRLWLKSVP